MQSWVRSPLMHLAPPINITEEELNDAFDRIDRSFEAAFKD